MRAIFCCFFLCCTLFLFAGDKDEVRHKIQGQTYVFRKVTIKNEVCCKPIQFLIISQEEGNTLKRLLTFPLFRSYEDGHYEEVELGNYQIEGNDLLLFTWWNFTGQDNEAPVGAKKIRYEVHEDGLLYWKSGFIYLEKGSRGEGAGFLKYPVSNLDEQAQFESYIRSVEKEHLAKFVFGYSSDKLCVEVRQELEAEIQDVKANW